MYVYPFKKFTLMYKNYMKIIKHGSMWYTAHTKVRHLKHYFTISCTLHTDIDVHCHTHTHTHTHTQVYKMYQTGIFVVGTCMFAFAFIVVVFC